MNQRPSHPRRQTQRNRIQRLRAARRTRSRGIVLLGRLEPPRARPVGVDALLPRSNVDRRRRERWTCPSPSHIQAATARNRQSDSEQSASPEREAMRSAAQRSEAKQSCRWMDTPHHCGEPCTRRTTWAIRTRLAGCRMPEPSCIGRASRSDPDENPLDNLHGSCNAECRITRMQKQF